MKKLSHLLLVLAAAAFVFTACEGPMGPEGPKGDTGDQGIQGIQGLQGIQGESGTTNCVLCHDNSTAIATATAQWEKSGHGMAEITNYGNREFVPGTDCAMCHVSQGFLEYYETGDIAGAPFLNPLSPNCYTCHEIHSTYTTDDWGLTYGNSFALMQGGATFDKGSGNLCAKCHQSRAVSPNPVPGGSGVTLTSNRWGGHHSPPANVVAGEGLYEITGGSTPYPSSAAHYVMDACVTCHLAPANGNDGGGHTWSMEYDYHGTETFNYNGCVACHADQTSRMAKFATLQTEIATKLETLRALLETEGIYDPANGRNATGAFTDDQAGAYLNWQLITEDKSLGVHNPDYVRAILDNCIEVLSAK
jgi:hypothetical protein